MSVKTFQYQTNSIHIMKYCNRHWLFASEVCKLLGYTNAASAVNLISPNHKLLLTQENKPQELKDVFVPHRGKYIISEIGMRYIVRHSRLKGNLAFKEWIIKLLDNLAPTLDPEPEPKEEVQPEPKEEVQPEPQVETPVAVKPEVKVEAQPEDFLVSQARLLLQMAEQMAGLTKHVKQLEKSHQTLADRIDQMTPGEGYVTVLAFCVRNKLKLTSEERKLLGRQAAITCKQRKLFVDKIPDRRLGWVNAYPEWVLDEMVKINSETT